MKKVFLALLISTLCLFSQTVSFKELTTLVSSDLGKNIYLDKDIKDYQVDINFADHQKKGQLYEFYKIVLFSHNMVLQYNKSGDFYYVKKKPDFKKVPVLDPKPLAAPKDRLHYYTYKIRNITNQDVVDCMSIFTNVKFKHLKQSDIIAYSATKEQHVQIQNILSSADNKVISKSVKITIFTVDKNKLRNLGVDYNAFGLSFQSLPNANLFDNLPSKYYFTSGFDADLYLSYLERMDVTKVSHSPTILLSNGVKAELDSVTNIRYLTGVAQVDNQNNNTITQNYEFKDVGLKIKLFPKIKDNWVYLDLSLISEEIISFEQDNPTTGKISYHNSFKITKGKPLLLTGINKSIVKTKNSGIPILKDLPILKELFSGDNISSADSNINILIEVL